MKTNDLFKNKVEDNPLYKVQEKYKEFLTNNEKKTSSVVDLFEDKGGYTMKECKIPPKKRVILNAKEENRLANAYKIERLFLNNRFAKSTTKDNSISIDVKLEYSKDGKYIKGFNDNVFINKISKIIENDYTPSSAIMSYLNLSYKCYSIFVEHATGEDVEVARLVFAN